MNSIEVKDIYKITAIYEFMGYWDTGKETTCSKGMRFVHFFFFVSFVVSMVVGTFITDDEDELAFLASTVVGYTVHVVSFFHIIFKRSKIIEFIRGIGPIITENQEDFTRINKKMKNLFNFGKFCVLLYVINIYPSLILLGVQAAVGKEKNLILAIAFPLDWRTNDIGYWLAFVFTFVEIAYGTSIFCFNVIIWYLMLCYAIKYELLGNQLRRLGTTDSKISEARKQNLFNQDLIALIKAHQKIRE